MKHRKILLLLGLAAMVVALVAMAVPAAALPQYTTATGQACGVCHVNPAGGGALTARGQAFAAVPTHTTDPAGAFAASGAAASPSPSPAASPAALPATGGVPILPIGLLGGFGLFALGWIIRRFGR